MLKQIGKYPIYKKIGQGAMGDVWYGHHPTLHVPVAIKTLSTKLAQDEEFIKRFIKEAQIAAQIKTQHAIMIYDTDVEDGHHYIVMEYVSGGTLKDMLKNGQRILPDFALTWTMHVTEALKAAQKLNIVHRDIKPENIILDDDDNAKIADLGIGKQQINLQDASVTSTGVIMGTAHYIAPEQIEDTSSADTRSDIYSLGCSLFEMLTGHVPYKGNSAMAVMMKHTNDPIPNPHQKVSQVPKPLAKVCMKMMAKSPNDRYQNPEELLQDLNLVKAGYDPFKKQTNNNRALIGLGTIILFLSALLLIDKKDDSDHNKEHHAPVTAQEAHPDTHETPTELELPQIPSTAEPLPAEAFLEEDTPNIELAKLEPLIEQEEQVVVENTKPAEDIESLTLEDLKIELLPVAAGKFTMGSPSSETGRRDNEEEHEVTISDDFWLSKTEVTVHAFKEFVEDTDYETDAEKEGFASFFNSRGHFKMIQDDVNWTNIDLRDNDAISMVSYFDAMRFCRWLTRRERRNGNIPKGYLYCLPTEAQWEYACRAGRDSISMDNLSDIAVYKDDQTELAVSLPAQKKANPWGFYDMQGNLQEFVLDRSEGFNWFDVTTSTYEDIVDPISWKGERAIFRGGSWVDEASSCRPAARGHAPRNYANNNHGFRLALIKASLLK